MEKLHIVTVATESKYYFPYLQDTCKKNGINLEVLGYGEKWKGFNSKFKLMKSYLENVDQTHLVCFVDGYDVICTRDLSTLANTFANIAEREKCKLIVGFDNLKYSNIFTKIASPLIFGKYRNSSLNSGTYIAKAGDLFNILTKILEINTDDKADDQMLLTKYAKMYDGDIYIYRYKK